MNTKPSNAPAPDELLLTAREALKTVLREPDDGGGYSIRMAMNAMGIAARAMRAEPLPPAHNEMSDGAFKSWIRGADETAVRDARLTAALRRHVEAKLAVSNPRFAPEAVKDQP